jgi:hypothetical protein
LDKHTAKDDHQALAFARRAQALAPQAKRAREAVFFSLQAQAKERTAARACTEVDAIVGEMDALKDVVAGQAWAGPLVMGACWAALGNAEYDASHWDGAARAYGRAYALMPEEKALAQNLARVDYNRAIALGKAGQCDDARPLVRKAQKGDASLVKDGDLVLEGCANQRAVAAAKGKDWARAVAELRRGLVDVPKSDVMKQNLAAMLGNLAQEHAHAHRCEDARELLDELRAAGRTDVAESVARTCRLP